MNFVKSLFTLVFVSVFVFGCEKEIISPEGQSVDLQANNEGINRPSNACGTSTFINFVDVNNNTMGVIEVLNTETQLFFLTDMNNGWSLQGLKVFVGNSLDLPKTGTGLIQVEEFPYQFTHSRAQDKTTFRVDISSLASCNGISVYGLAVQTNQFGQVTNTRHMWANGATVLNGKMFNHCVNVCNQNANGPLQNI